MDLRLLRDEVSTDTIFQMTGSTVRFGSGATREVGAEFVDLRCRRVLVFVDPAVRDLYPGEAALESLRSAGLSFDVFSDIRCEPTDSSFREAIAAASSSRFDGFLAVGGGSTIDTAKAANLYATWPAEFIEYVNPTLGRGATPPGPLKPLIAVPTTAGTGSETTAVAVFDFERERVKTGIANRLHASDARHPRPREHPHLPESGRRQRRARRPESRARVVHRAALSRTRTARAPSQRSAYQGANPISDVWALEALRIIAECLPRAYKDPSDDEARGRMLLAASYAGIGFGNAGVHLPHAMAYPVAGNVEHYQPAGYRPITRWCRTGRRSSCIRPPSAARPHLQRPSATCRRRRPSARTFVT